MIIKELSSKKLKKDKEIFSKISNELIEKICSFWIFLIEEGFKFNLKEEYIYYFNNCKICIKIITELIVGSEKLNEISIKFLNILLEKLKKLIKYRKKEEGKRKFFLIFFE